MKATFDYYLVQFSKEDVAWTITAWALVFGCSVAYVAVCGSGTWACSDASWTAAVIVVTFVSVVLTVLVLVAVTGALGGRRRCGRKCIPPLLGCSLVTMLILGPLALTNTGVLTGFAWWTVGLVLTIIGGCCVVFVCLAFCR